MDYLKRPSNNNKFTRNFFSIIKNVKVETSGFSRVDGDGETSIAFFHGIAAKATFWIPASGSNVTWKMENI